MENLFPGTGLGKDDSSLMDRDRCLKFPVRLAPSPVLSAGILCFPYNAIAKGGGAMIRYEPRRALRGGSIF